MDSFKSQDDYNAFKIQTDIRLLIARMEHVLTPKQLNELISISSRLVQLTAQLERLKEDELAYNLLKSFPYMPRIISGLENSFKGFATLDSELTNIRYPMIG